MWIAGLIVKRFIITNNNSYVSCFAIDATCKVTQIKYKKQLSKNRRVNVCAYLCCRAAGTVEFNETVPDTITSWIATAFAIHPQSGLGLSEASANVSGPLNTLINAFNNRYLFHVFGGHLWSVYYKRFMYFGY